MGTPRRVVDEEVGKAGHISSQNDAHVFVKYVLEDELLPSPRILDHQVQKLDPGILRHRPLRDVVDSKQSVGIPFQGPSLEMCPELRGQGFPETGAVEENGPPMATDACEPV